MRFLGIGSKKSTERGSVVSGGMDIERRGTYNPLGGAPVGILPQPIPILEFVAFRQRRLHKRREPRLSSQAGGPGYYPDGATVYLFPGAYDPMVQYPGPSEKRMIRKQRTACKEIWEY